MPATPTWLEGLVHHVAATMTAYSPMGPLGLRYRRLQDLFDVLVYPLPLEMIGGAHDGGLAVPNFSLALPEVLSAFTRVDAVNWHAHGVGDDEGPCVSIEGVYHGWQVWLRVLACAPADVGPGLKVSANDGRQAG